METDQTAGMISGKRVFITGADRFIGSHLAETLVRAGAAVTALACYNSFDSNGWLDDLPEDVRDNLEIVRGDVRDAGHMDTLIRGRDIVFHLAALIAIPYSYAAPRAYLDVNAGGTLGLLEAARRHAVWRFIHTSTSEVYGTAQTRPIAETHPLQGQSPYSASKIAADMLVESFARSFDLPAIILRPFNTYGPRQSERAIIPTIIRQAIDPACDVIRLGDLRPIRDFNFVADTVGAFQAIAVANGIDFGTAYNAGTGHSVSIGDVVNMVGAITGANKPIETEAVRLRPEGSEVWDLIADASRLKTATGWRAQTDLQAGITATIEWWKRRAAAGQLRRGRGYAT